LVVEYEAVLIRHLHGGLRPNDVEAFVDYLCHIARRQDIFFLWRPFLKDPDDDMLVEVAVAGQCRGIVTHNIRDFAGVEKLGLRAFTPAEFLLKVRGAS
jgi:predicted nucleic acid-binding protein